MRVEKDGVVLLVDVLRSGQERAYGDSRYEYDVEVAEGDDCEDVVRSVMVYAFRLPERRKEDWAWSPAAVYFAGWLDARRTGERRWRVEAMRPYAD